MFKKKGGIMASDGQVMYGGTTYSIPVASPTYLESTSYSNELNFGQDEPEQEYMDTPKQPDIITVNTKATIEVQASGEWGEYSLYGHAKKGGTVKDIIQRIITNLNDALMQLAQEGN